jgi:hypothetical protein
MQSTRIRHAAVLALGATAWGSVLTLVFTAVPIAIVPEFSGELSCALDGNGYSFWSVLRGGHGTTDFLLSKWQGSQVQRTNAVSIRTASSPDAVVPDWARDLLPPAGAGPFDSIHVFAIRFGWPMRAFQYSSSMVWRPPSPVESTDWRARVVPLGLVADVSMFGALALGVRAFALRVRRHRRRTQGRCESCAHPVLSAAICPECGNASGLRRDAVRPSRRAETA